MRARLPDFQVLIAARQHAAARAAPLNSPGGGSSSSSISAAGGVEGGGDVVGQAQLLLPRLLQVLGRYIALFPECLAESRLDLPRLLADPAALALPPALLQTLTLLRSAPPRSGAWLASAKNVSVVAVEGAGVGADKLRGAERVGEGKGQGAAGKKGAGVKGKEREEAAVEVGSYLGVLLVLVAQARRQGSRITLLRREAEALAASVLSDTGLFGDDDALASEEARVWLHHVGACEVRASKLEKLCLEAGQGRLHALSLAAMSISEQGDASGEQGAEGGEASCDSSRGKSKEGGKLGSRDGATDATVEQESKEGDSKAGGVGGLVLKPCPPGASRQLRRWAGAAGGSPAGGNGGGGVSALLVFALDKLEKSRADGAGEEKEKKSEKGERTEKGKRDKGQKGECMGVGGALIREVVVSLFHRSARPTEILRALWMVADPEGCLAPLVAYCQRAVGVSVGGNARAGVAAARADAQLSVEERALIKGLQGEGRREELAKGSWAVWASGGVGGLLSEVISAEARGEGVKMVERAVRAMPWAVLLSQAVVAGVSCSVPCARMMIAARMMAHAEGEAEAMAEAERKKKRGRQGGREKTGRVERQRT